LEAVKIEGRCSSKEEIEHGYRFAKPGGVATQVRFRVTAGFSKLLLVELVTLRSNQPKTASAGSALKILRGTMQDV